MATAEDKSALKAYLEKVARARTTKNLINPDESTLEKMERIRKAKEDYGFMVKTYFPHYCTKDDIHGNPVVVECADFQIDHIHKVRDNPLYMGYAEWGRGLAKSVHHNVFLPIFLWMNKQSRFFCLASDTFDRACDLLEDIRCLLYTSPSPRDA